MLISIKVFDGDEPETKKFNDPEDAIEYLHGLRRHIMLNPVLCVAPLLQVI